MRFLILEYNKAKGSVNVIMDVTFAVPTIDVRTRIPKRSFMIWRARLLSNFTPSELFYSALMLMGNHVPKVM
jgi:hypothetical protein